MSPKGNVEVKQPPTKEETTRENKVDLLRQVHVETWDLINKDWNRDVVKKSGQHKDWNEGDTLYKWGPVEMVRTVVKRITNPKLQKLEPNLGPYLLKRYDRVTDLIVTERDCYTYKSY